MKPTNADRMDPVIREDEAARRLQTTPQHLRRLTAQHGLAYLKIGGRRRYLLSDLDAFIERSRQARTQVS